MGGMDMKAIGRNLEYARTQIAKITQEELAQATGISSRRLRDWEKGDAPGQWENLATICSVLGVSPCYLLAIPQPTHTEANIEDEWGILKKYRSLSDEDKVIVDAIVMRLLGGKTPFVSGGDSEE